MPGVNIGSDLALSGAGGNFAGGANDAGYFVGFVIPKDGNAVLTARITLQTKG